ncbi:GolD/DthD family dehydrogenase [Nesterenkonia sp. HG001]|uniref:GolD/DthD family dehydrogenase n=1 Tax=Nesterenkonia sp. HG001 TaxID=2983207 RepID=UPI002AC51F4B|nr:D-threitol dehydrogenase [Nesterenkonia sp. HG001]MDZ5077683.1 D-threitol dehydrogenase [Nesterenkonia sp. HG001]
MSSAGAALFDLTGRVAVVTGGASGLGQAIAHGFARQHAKVVLADLDADRLTATAEQLRAAHPDGGGVDTRRLDVIDAEAVEETLAAVVADHGAVDILVNSAGIVALDPVEQVPVETWEKVLQVNLTGTFLACRAAGRHMKAAEYGRIVNIASQAAHVALEHHAAYGASKSGLFGLTASLARELGPHGVTANTISPTVVMTELGRQVWDGPHGEAHQAEIPTRRFAEPEEIAAAVVYLSSQEAAMVNGADLRIDGGFTIV